MGQNKMRGKPRRTWIRAWLIIVLLAVAASSLGQAQVIYRTGFEPDEGYDIKFTLAGQGGWLAEGTGGSGLVQEAFQDLGNQAYVGFWAPLEDDEGYVNLWRPLDVPKTNATRLRFSVIMMVADDDKEQRDEFRWSIYNSETKRLASIDFDNHSQTINYELDDGNGFQDTEFGFERNTIYDLSIEMDFSKNQWSALIGGESIVDKKPLTTTGAKLELGDISAVWVYREVGKAGENYMVFDEYKIEQLEDENEEPEFKTDLALKMKNGLPTLSFGPGKTALEASQDLKNWETLTTSTEPSEYTDEDFPKHPLRFYRLRKIE